MRIGKVRFKWVNSWKDKKTGIVYTKYRPPGCKAITLPNTIGSAEFVAAHAAAIRGESLPQAAAEAISRSGSVKSAIERYIAECSTFNGNGESTRARQASTLRKFSREHGDKPFALLDTEGVKRILADAAPQAARFHLICLRGLMQWAVSAKLIKVDPCVGLKVTPPKSDGHETWSEEQIAQFEAHWAIGTKERLALALLVHTGQRRSDVVRMGPQHVRNGVLKIKQQKKTKAGQQTVEFPAHPELASAIAACSMIGTTTFLVTATGKPFTEREFNEFFRKACDAAGLPQSCVPHGLRKACCRRLADLGLSPQRIAAISGHVTLKEIEHYTKAYDRRHAAKEAMAALVASHAKPQASAA